MGLSYCTRWVEDRSKFLLPLLRLISLLYFPHSFISIPIVSRHLYSGLARELRYGIYMNFCAPPSVIKLISSLQMVIHPSDRLRGGRLPPLGLPRLVDLP